MKNSDKIIKATNRMVSKQKPFKERSGEERKIRRNVRFNKDCNAAAARNNGS